MEIRDELVLELTKGCKIQEDFNDLFRALKKRGLEAALSGELTDHLGFDKHARAQERKTNSRNGYSKKTVQSANGSLELDIPRDRQGDFEPQIISRYQTRFDGCSGQVKVDSFVRGFS